MATFNNVRFTGPSSFSSRPVTPGDLDINGVLHIDQALGEATPILELDPGLVLRGIELLDNGVGINGTAFADGAQFRFRCSGGNALLINEESGLPVTANQRLSITVGGIGTDVRVDNRLLTATYDTALGRWRLDASYLFGQGFEQVDRIGPQATTVDPNIGIPPTYLSMASMGSPIVVEPGSLWLISVDYFLEVSNNNTVYWVDLKINGVSSPIGANVETLSLAGAQAVRHTEGVVPESVFGPNFWFDLDFARASGTGSVIMDSANMHFWRVG